MYLIVCSGACVLVNVLPPPNLFVDKITDGNTDGFSSVRVESFAYKLIQQLYVSLRKIQGDQLHGSLPLGKVQKDIAEVIADYNMIQI